MAARILRVVQCWDDGNVADIRLCEILRSHGAKASFNLNPGLHRESRYEGWRYKDVHPVLKLSWGELASVYEGFTIANHSVSHPHPSKIPLAEWKTEVVEGRKRLQDRFGQAVLGFAYPFGDFGQSVGREREVMDAVREAGHVYARTCENATPSFPAAESMRQATDLHFLSPAFWDRYAAAKASGAGVFYFWGHSYELIDDAMWKEFDAKMARIATDPEARFAELPSLFEGAAT